MLDSLSIAQLLTADSAGLSTAALFFIFFFGTYVSEDATCLAAGGAAAAGEISFTLAVIACFLGILSGDILLYWTGRIFGPRILGLPFLKRLASERALAQAGSWLEARGASVIFLSRFVTGFRLPTYLAAGFLRANFPKFVFYFVIAAAIWTPILVGSVTFAGRLASGNVVIAAIGIFVIIRLVMTLSNFRRRRLAIGKLKRIVRWEFWPLSIFYTPVVFYVLWLAVKHRSLTVFTCANPSIPAGGFVGESKNAIYKLLSTSRDNDEFLLPHRKIAGTLFASEKTAVCEEFMTAHGLEFPVVLKPDTGERGKGVRIVASKTDLDVHLRDASDDRIIQEYAAGDEASIFYYRFPGSARGEIFSVTQKVFPFVIGDGMSTLEELILDDNRAVCLAEKYFAENNEHLEVVPEAGERVPIISIGTHSRGAVFLDGRHLMTNDLADTIDALCRRTDGFYFGRFDIRYSSLADFQAGVGFKIIELNGVTSESTNIYDPRYSLFDAYRILFKQWRIVFEIGAENRRLGARASSTSELWRLVLAS